jgi:RNA polymerase sigma-70 factor (ECF subfamily)
VTDETEQIRMARAGDQSAFGHLVTAYQTPVYNLAYRMLGDAAEAEEAAQEAFLRAYTSLRSYDPQRPFRSWLLSITSHYCIDRLRRRRLTWLSLDDEEEEGYIRNIAPERLASDCPDPEAVMVQQEREEWIQQLLAALPPTDRATVALRYWYDCSYEEIAETLHLTVSAVKSRLHRARCALAKTMAVPAPTAEGELNYAL